MDQSQPAACFAEQSVTEAQRSVCMLSAAASARQCELSSATETSRPPKPKILTIYTLIENLASSRVNQRARFFNHIVLASC